jgi:GT2 family glycosyltransferase
MKTLNRTLASAQDMTRDSSAGCFARITARGKFLWAGDEKFYVRGVTYGPFHPDPDGSYYPRPEIVDCDFSQMIANGINAVRTYDVPPFWVLDLAQSHGLRVMTGLQVEQFASFLDEEKTARDIKRQVRARVDRCAGHTAVMAYIIANEIPASIVRWHGPRRVERFLEELYSIAKEGDPEGLFCYANYPTTEHLDLGFMDVSCFNVYLESQASFEAYLARLQNLAGHRPLLMTEVGLDSRGSGQVQQARVLDWQLRSAFQGGCAGAFVFAWTDDWYSRGKDVDDWDFGLTDRSRAPKPALTAVREAYAEAPFPSGRQWPRISVVVCTYNGHRTIRDCLDGLQRLEYSDYETIVVNDGSTDGVADIAQEYASVRLISTENRGLSAARNTGMEAATGEIVAYIDDDAAPDPLWLQYLAAAFLKWDCAAVGGPNIPMPGDGPIATCVANAPGGPTAVLLSDTEAEHIAGCNMAFRKSWLQAIGGFDPQFRIAGDDVDICWRLRERGAKLGYSPAAIVWHHYRNSLRAYWKQQAGYGKAEALLERKWPEKFNAMGHISWRGRIYFNGLLGLVACGPPRIYQGTWGSAAYARLYFGPPGPLKTLLLMPESFLVIVGFVVLAAAGQLWKPLFLAGAMPVAAIGVSLAWSMRNALRLRFPPLPRAYIPLWQLQLLTALLHPFQFLARLKGRIRFGLTPWRTRNSPPALFPWRRILWLASKDWLDVIERLRSLECALRASDAIVRRGGDFDDWDLELRTGILGNMRVVMADEYSGGKQLVRVRVSPKPSGPALALMLSLAVLSLTAAAARAPAASIFLASAVVMLGILLLRDCAGAAATVHRSLSAAGFRRRKS